ncbi:substrate-binding periplasmic protein [Aestuariirhabdus litorea]|nr:transporter substrate-binding domain-containing protein [Aestuariirhabdus litorea]
MIVKVAFVLLCLLPGLALAAEKRPPKQITLVYEVKANPPFYLGNGTTIDWEKPGITLEMLKLLESRLKLEIQFIRRPWARGLEEVRTNRVDGIFHSSFQWQRMVIGRYPMNNGWPDADRKIMSQSYHFYTTEGSPLQWDGSRLSQLNGAVGAVIEYAIIRDLEEMNIPVEVSTSQEGNLRKLVAGRIAAIADIETMTDYQLQAHPEEFKSIVKLEPAIRTKPYYLVLSHRFVEENPALAEAIWNEIKVIRTSEHFDRIARKYLQPQAPSPGAKGSPLRFGE